MCLKDSPSEFWCRLKFFMSIIKTFISTWEEDLAVYKNTLMIFHAHLQNNFGSQIPVWKKCCKQDCQLIIFGCEYLKIIYMNCGLTNEYSSDLESAFPQGVFNLTEIISLFLSGYCPHCSTHKRHSERKQEHSIWR